MRILWLACFSNISLISAVQVKEILFVKVALWMQRGDSTVLGRSERRKRVQEGLGPNKAMRDSVGVAVRDGAEQIVKRGKKQIPVE